MADAKTWHPLGVSQEKLVLGLALVLIVTLCATHATALWLGTELADGRAHRAVLHQAVTIDSLSREIDSLQARTNRLGRSCPLPRPR